MQVFFAVNHKDTYIQSNDFLQKSTGKVSRNRNALGIICVADIIHKHF